MSPSSKLRKLERAVLTMSESLGTRIMRGIVPGDSSRITWRGLSSVVDLVYPGREEEMAGEKSERGFSTDLLVILRADLIEGRTSTTGTSSTGSTYCVCDRTVFDLERGVGRLGRPCDGSLVLMVSFARKKTLVCQVIP